MEQTRIERHMSGDSIEPCGAELAWRETTLYRFIDPADRAALLRVGRLLHLQALDQPAGGDPSAIHAELRAAARDLRNLQSFLEMVACEGDDTEPGASGLALTESAETWGQEVARLASSIERELDPSDGLTSLTAISRMSLEC
jgi:hypothetical protein